MWYSGVNNFAEGSSCGLKHEPKCYEKLICWMERDRLGPFPSALSAALIHRGDVVHGQGLLRGFSAGSNYQRWEDVGKVWVALFTGDWLHWRRYWCAPEISERCQLSRPQEVQIWKKFQQTIFFKWEGLIIHSETCCVTVCYIKRMEGSRQFRKKYLSFWATVLWREERERKKGKKRSIKVYFIFS